MNDKRIKETIKQYIETQTDNILSEVEEKDDFTSLDKKVYATLSENQEKRENHSVLSLKKIGVLAASFVLIVGLSITAIFISNKEPTHVLQDVNYSITILYEDKEYGYYSNRAVIDKYELNDDLNLIQNPNLFTEILNETDIIQTDSVIDKDSIIGAKIYPYTDEVIILQVGERFYYFEKAITS